MDSTEPAQALGKVPKLVGSWGKTGAPVRPGEGPDSAETEQETHRDFGEGGESLLISGED